MDSNTPETPVNRVTPPVTAPTAVPLPNTTTPTQPGHEVDAGAPTTTPPAQRRPPTRQERFADDPSVLPSQEAEQHEKQEPPLAADTLRFEYMIRIRGGKEIIVDINGKFDLPLALREECLAKTEADFPEILDKVVFAPVLIQVRAYLQRRFEGYAMEKNKAVANEAVPHSRVNEGHPAFNGSQPKMPQIDLRLPLTLPPDKAIPSARRNGG